MKIRTYFTLAFLAALAAGCNTIIVKWPKAGPPIVRHDDKSGGVKTNSHTPVKTTRNPKARLTAPVPNKVRTYRGYVSCEVSVDAIKARLVEDVDDIVKHNQAGGHIYVHGYASDVRPQVNCKFRTNREISRLRAQDVKLYLVKKGADPRRIHVFIHGSHFSSRKSSSKDRKVEIVIAS